MDELRWIVYLEGRLEYHNMKMKTAVQDHDWDTAAECVGRVIATENQLTASKERVANEQV